MTYSCKLGIPTISSSINPLSGELCPGRVTFSCDSLDTNSPVIDYYIDDTRLVRYEYDPSHRFPFVMDTTLSGVTVQITSANVNGTEYSFFNFTFSADLNDIFPYQRKSLTCGTVSVRSNSIPIGLLNIKGKICLDCIIT